MKIYGIFLVVIALVIAFIVVRTFNLRKTNMLSQMQLSSQQAVPEVFAFNRQDPTQSQIPGLEISKITTPGVHGYKFMPRSKPTLKRPVVVFSGSEGYINFLHAIVLAQAGHPVYALYFFAGDTGISVLANIELSFFQTALDYIAADQALGYNSSNDGFNVSSTTSSPHHNQTHLNLNPGQSPEYQADHKIDLLGVSKGAELALILANNYANHIYKLVLFSPSAYHWQGLDFNSGNKDPKPSWVGFNMEKHYLKFTSIYAVAKMFFKAALGQPLDVYDQYATVLKTQTHELASSLLPVNHISFPVLIFAGNQDKIWPSVEMSQVLATELGSKAQVITYPQAGHLFLGPSVISGIAVGGVYNANVEALVDSNQKLITFLDQ